MPPEQIRVGAHDKADDDRAEKACESSRRSRVSGILLSGRRQNRRVELIVAGDSIGTAPLSARRTTP
jgi:hypothetical protein